MSRIKRPFCLLITTMVCLILCSCGFGKDKGGADGSSASFIKGADISSLEAVEDNGGKFYDFDGKEIDVIEF